MNEKPTIPESTHKLMVGTGPYAWKYAVCKCGKAMNKFDGTPIASDVQRWYSQHLEERIAQLEQHNKSLNAELDKGDSWAWIRKKFEKCRTQFTWHKPRTDSLVGTRYEVMGWLHVLFAHADPQVYIDITMEHQKKADIAERALFNCISAQTHEPHASELVEAFKDEARAQLEAEKKA